MKKLLILLKLCFKFSKKYMMQYLSQLLKPIFIAVIGIAIFGISLLLTYYFGSPIFSFVALLSIPCICYAFWRGYVITYALIPCAEGFVKENTKPLKQFITDYKIKEGALAKYVCFIALLTLVLYIPACVYTSKILPSGDFMTTLSNIKEYLKPVNRAFLINSLILAPFLNYALCAFYYKKEKENYFQLFFNCYKKLNLLGLLLALIIILFSFKQIILYFILALFLNPLIYSINTFWYLSRPGTNKK